jgi:putative ABC transport system substrate-binding protein
LPPAQAFSPRAPSLPSPASGGGIIRRREFIALLTGGAAAAWPLAARAEPTKVPVIGFLGTTTHAVWAQPVAAFERRLNELGWIAGRTITIDYRWTEGRNDLAPEYARAFVQRHVDIMVVGGNSVAAAKQATTSIPIVFPVAVDPVGSGFVDNLSRPGGNVTGLSLQGPDVAGKRLELLRDIVPGLHRVAIMANVSYPAAAKELAASQIACRTLGLEATALELRQADDIPAAFDSLHGNAEALYAVSEALVNSNHTRIATLALGAHLPTIFGTTDLMEAGGLMAYGPNLPAMFRRAADYVDKILRGTKPGDIPVEQPTAFELVINLNTAKALGLTVPPTLLAIADQVIE